MLVAQVYPKSVQSRKEGPGPSPSVTTETIRNISQQFEADTPTKNGYSMTDVIATP